MFFWILIFLVLGVSFGVVTGLVPGIHPNLIVLMVPILMNMNMEPIYVISFITAMAVTNSITDFIPSILLGIPDAGNELSILPGHRMVMKGHGYDAIKFTVIGGLGSVIICLLIIPLIVFCVPFLYTILKNYIYIVLIFIAVYMIIHERGWKKIAGLLCFLLAGIIGILSMKLPLDNSIGLFPMLSGLFGASMILLQIRNKTKIPVQSSEEIYIPRKTINRSIVTGTMAGILSGFMPGVGSSQIAALTSVEKNDISFLVKIGAITTANIIISIIALWIIGKGRSGIAIVIGELMNIGFHEFLLIIIISVIASGLGCLITLKIAKKSVSIINQINYSRIGVFVLCIITLLVFIFSGFYGLLLLFTCTSLGIFANIVGIRRGNLMGVLILPVILLYIGFL